MDLSKLTPDQKINLLNAFACIIKAREAAYQKYLVTEDSNLLEAYKQYRDAEIGISQILNEINVFV